MIEEVGAGKQIHSFNASLVPEMNDWFLAKIGTNIRKENWSQPVELDLLFKIYVYVSVDKFSFKILVRLFGDICIYGNPNIITIATVSVFRTGLSMLEGSM